MSQIPYPVGSEIYNMATTGSATGAPQGFNMGQLSSILNFANMGLGMMGMGKTTESMDEAFRTAGVFGDIGTGRDYHAAESDFERQMRAAQWGNKFKANDPFLRQNELYASLKNPGLAGRYGSFVS